MSNAVQIILASTYTNELSLSHNAKVKNIKNSVHVAKSSQKQNGTFYGPTQCRDTKIN